MMTATQKGAAILACAYSWIGTPYQHQGRVKGPNGGVDCLGLVIGIALELQLTNNYGQLLSHFDQQDYGRVPDTNQLHQQLQSQLRPVFGDWHSGDVLVFNILGRPQHLGIYDGTTNSVIHAYEGSRTVMSQRLERQWRRRIAGAYRI